MFQTTNQHKYRNQGPTKNGMTPKNGCFAMWLSEKEPPLALTPTLKNPTV